MSGGTAWLASRVSREHDTGPGHPEQPARFDAALRGLAGRPLSPFEGRTATEEDLLLCHGREYLRTVERDVASGREVLATGDTQICPRSLDVALAAAGTVLEAVDRVAGGAAKNAFAIVRPPGHHATSDRGMGFCLFNNVALAARHAQKRHGVGRVLIADWDVHHGNGTQEIFYSDGSVLFFSTHQHPWYPGTGDANETGEGTAEGTTINCPLPAGSGRQQVLGAFEHLLLPAVEDFRPEFVFISAGFDSRLGDPLGRFRLTDHDFGDLTRLMAEIADRYAYGRMVSVLEGGYNLDGLEAAVGAHAAELERAAR
jgi:acetoin utilization deacetylase AcuC-like enzyme